MEHPATPPPLNRDLLDMMARGVSVIVSACGHDLTPSVMRALGSQVSASGDFITVYLGQRPSAQLLRDVAASGRMAVVFSEPSTHRTVQLKTHHARMREARPEDATVLQRYRLAMQQELGGLGFGPAFVSAMFAHTLDDVVAVEFTPDEAFDQTPGPRAGQPLGGPAP
ncbi:hypothetical protein [Hydrogenophaga sp.]|uniref:hypothetical protein n=1 Tax=Hydrogenophaga sp. TaxID=1904254 RepID=UPI0025BB0BF4|nr:hypothetical protein [Hydrogenophaga sp.]